VSLARHSGGLFCLEKAMSNTLAATPPAIRTRVGRPAGRQSAETVSSRTEEALLAAARAEQRTGNIDAADSILTAVKVLRRAR
jgi:hypothetical protein